ncbi:hypothetical protein PV569_13140 [Streptomyces scabiei]|uniref:hypothetical protein n=1 Tax=Streptomyces scabiei TaxID=1930 RepID=UPI0029B2AF9C|nr:hypothetical protein [Streptomyces scabiei]MDX3294652.1 hypothetical protein [Streptomyces scabiei]
MTAPAEAELGQEHAAVPAEDVPDGTFGRPLYRLPAHITPCTPAEQAAHFTELAEALCGFSVGAAMRRHRSSRKEAPAS